MSRVCCADCMLVPRRTPTSSACGESGCFLSGLRSHPTRKNPPCPRYAILSPKVMVPRIGLFVVAGSEPAYPTSRVG